MNGGTDPDRPRVEAALDGYRRAVREVAVAPPAATVRARAERRTARHRAVGAAVAVAAVLAMAAGGVALAGRVRGSGPEQHPAASGSAPVPPGPPSGGPSGSAVPSGGPTRKPTSAPGPCRAAALFGRVGGPTVSGTRASGYLELINTGAPCTVAGYLGLQWQRLGSSPAPASVEHQPGTTAPVTIGTGGAARSLISWTRSGGSSCVAPDGLVVTVTGDPAPLTVPWIAGPVCGTAIRSGPLTG
jgi:hypothetical protein